MPDPETPAFAFQLLILASACLVLLIFLLIMTFRISGRLARIERQRIQTTHNKGNPESAERGPSLAETSPGGAFEAFLKEDPARREMSKAEQFAAYREWRDEKGMNWSNS